MTVDRQAIEVLEPVITCARGVLSDMESDDVPIALRKVTRSSARTLPPPLAKSLIRELTASESFRGDVLERYEGGDRVDDDLLAYLTDPVVGLRAIEARADASKDADHDAALESARERIAALDDQLAESKRRLSGLRAQHDSEMAKARSSVSEGQRRAEARIQSLNRTVAEARAKEQDLTGQIRVLTEELDAVKSRLTGATERLRRREASASAGPRTRTDETTSDPLEFARWLDDVERRIRPFRETRPIGHEWRVPGPLVIGPGISPDSPGALQTLIAQNPRRFLLDGYNIGGEIDAANFSTRPGRDEVVRKVGVLARATNAEVVVVFDGPDDEGRSGFRSPDGVTVRFSKGQQADDVIADLVAADPDRVVVITNDRELRRRCAVDGCVQIWSTAFLGWL